MLLQFEGFERCFQFRGDAGHDAPGGLPGKSQLSDPDGLELTQGAHDFFMVACKAPFPPQPGAHPVGQKAEPDVIDDPVRAVVMDGTHFQISTTL